MKIFKITILFSSLLLLSYGSVSASSFSLNMENSQVKEGDTFSMTAYLKTEGEIINTIEGDIRYDDKILELQQVLTGGSFVSFWIEKPDGNGGGQTNFSGVVPGGINTTKSEAFSLVFKAKIKGETKVVLDNLNLYLNDGEGTKTKAPSTSASISITSSGGASSEFSLNDDVVPEEFDIERAKDESVYEDKWFVAFNAQDKGTGIGYYKVCEFWVCSVAESPYALKNQTPFYYVSVEAYDLNGNKRSSGLVSPYLMLVLAVPAVFYGFYRRFYLKKI